MEIRFDNFLYTHAAVNKAIRDYKDLADFFCKEKKDCTIVRINNIRQKELKPFFKQEFANYVLSFMGVLK